MMKNFLKISRRDLIIFVVGLSLLVGVEVFIRYKPTLDYWLYQMEGGSVVLVDEVQVKLGQGWYPIQLYHDGVFFRKIDLWWPQLKTAPEVWISGKNKEPFTEEVLSKYRKVSFPWGEGLIVKDPTGGGLIKVPPGEENHRVRGLNGRVFILADRPEDIQEILELKLVAPKPKR